VRYTGFHPEKKLAELGQGMTPRGFFLVSIVAGTLSALAIAQSSANWPVYGGGPESNHYSPLAQINRINVHKLKVAWTFDTGEQGNLEVNPVIVDGTLYAYTHRQKVIALDAASGKLKWAFDSGINGTQPARGIAYWTDGQTSRIFAGVMNFLYCLDARTGGPIGSFGENGRIDLRKGLRGDYEEQSIALTTPGIIYKNLIIVGGRNPETHPAPPGDVRAFDVRTGAQRWVFHTIPHPGEPGYETWPADAWQTAGAANNWAGMSLDAALGIVYVPTGSAVMDFYGGDRAGDDRYADTLLALDAETGKLLWHFQEVHHDIWDRDLPTAPALYTLHREGKTIEALAQITKQGTVYLFNRATGEPLFPIHEHPYPASNVPGEVAARTQPSPTWPLPFARQRLTEDQLTTRNPAAHAWAVMQFRSFRSDGQFVPFALDKQTVVFPGFDGGGEWAGPALDPRTDVLFISSSEMAWTGGLTEAKDGAGAGETLYRMQCAACHGVNRAGSPPSFPSLIGIDQRLTAEKVTDTIHNGGGRMPSFPNIHGTDLEALLNFLGFGSGVDAPSSLPQQHSDYTFTGYRRFLDPDGYPAINPPWGTLNALDLKTGKYLWRIPLGEYPELALRGLKNTGSELYGGPIVTAGGLVFIGASVFDRKFRAFDSQTGKLVWETTLPFAGMATPSTYMVEDRQYVVIAASGGRDPKGPNGGAFVAFALPEGGGASR
jgi:quinoprotein glucose dehydrogenase